MADPAKQLENLRRRLDRIGTRTRLDQHTLHKGDVQVETGYVFGEIHARVYFKSPQRGKVEIWRGQERLKGAAGKRLYARVLEAIGLNGKEA